MAGAAFWRSLSSFCVAGAVLQTCRIACPTLHTLHSTLHTLHSTLHTLHSTLHTPYCTLHTSPHSTLYTAHSTLYNLHFTVYTLHSTLRTLLFTLHTLHSTLGTLHSTLRTPLITSNYQGPKIHAAGKPIRSWHVAYKQHKSCIQATDKCHRVNGKVTYQQPEKVANKQQEQAYPRATTWCSSPAQAE